MGFYLSNLSPINPATKFEVNPQKVKISALSNEYSALKLGYVLKKKTGKNEAMIASEKCLITPAAVINLVVGFFPTSDKERDTLLKKLSFG